MVYVQSGLPNTHVCYNESHATREVVSLITIYHDYTQSPGKIVSYVMKTILQTEFEVFSFCVFAAWPPCTKPPWWGTWTS